MCHINIEYDIYNYMLIMINMIQRKFFFNYNNNNYDKIVECYIYIYIDYNYKIYILNI